MNNLEEDFNSWWYEGKCTNEVNPFQGDTSQFWAFEGFVAGLNKANNDKEKQVDEQK